MRGAFATDLARLERATIDDLGVAANALATIAAAVDAPSAERTRAIARDGARLRGAANNVHAELIRVTACQAPVAGDLRLVIAMIELTHHAMLIANQFGLISQQLADIDPLVPEPGDVAERLARLAALASAQLRKATTAFRTRDLALARELDHDDDAIDALNREIFSIIARAECSGGRREAGFRRVLIARSVERIGDNAVDIGEQAEFLLTGEPREFSDASRPRRRAAG
jgi:phosphate transport system protein